MDFLTSAWTLVVVPTAIAVSALIAFWKTVLEKRNVELENRRLQIDLEAASSRIVVPNADEISKYSFTQTFVRRTIRIGSIVLAVALPTILVLQNAKLEQGSESPPTNIGEQPTPAQPTPAPPPITGAVFGARSCAATTAAVDPAGSRWWTDQAAHQDQTC